MFEGTILKGFSGFYYVQTEEGILECSLRGRYRLSDQRFLPGDSVRVKPVGAGKGVIEEVLPRRTELVRPPVANVEQAIVVMAADNPSPDMSLLDRLLIVIEAAGVVPVICWNKADLARTEDLEDIATLYKRAGYPVLVTSAKTGLGLDGLGERMSRGISVLAGPSGVGKSSLLNALQPGLKLKTGQVSDKLGRGRHTTRHVELLPLDSGGLVADTPGFSRLEIPTVAKEEVDRLFPEMEPYLSQCRFTSCLHRQEPQCAVREAVERGEVEARRYARYLEFLEEVIARERRY